MKRRIRVMFDMVRRGRCFTRYGVVCRGCDGRFYAYTWRLKTAVCGAANVSQAAEWLQRGVTRRPVT